MSAEPLPLDDYEAANLLWLLRVAKRLGLDTGDWLMQLTRKLEARGHSSVRGPNASPDDTETWLLEAARKVFKTSKQPDLTPRAIACPSCRAAPGKVCLTYIEPDAADDLATHVPLYCAARIDEAFAKLARLVEGAAP